jgi:hypothetical protein
MPSGAARGQVVFASATVLVSLVALVLLDRVGPEVPSAPVSTGAISGAWLCPHGGGADWTVALFLANPGSAPVTARLTALRSETQGQREVHEIPAGGSIRIDLSSPDRGGATYVEYFGGWIGAGWVVRAGEGEGTAAEPCAPEASRHWYVADGTTQLREDAFVVVANPFDVPAVLDVVLYTPTRAPIRDSEWTDLVVPARRSIALHLNSKVEGEPAVAAALRVSVGRVAAASLGITGRTKVRSSLGWSAPAPGAIFPVMMGSGQSELMVLSIEDASVRFGATSLSEEPPRPAGGLTEQEHAPAAALAYAVPVENGPWAIQAFTLDGARVIGALRALGPGEDPAASAGAMSPAASWLILPAAAGDPSNPGAVLVNPGEEDVRVGLEILPGEDGTAAVPIMVDVPAHSAAAVPPGFLEAAAEGGVIARADTGGIVALAASTSLGEDGLDAFALSLGVPLPQAL